MAFPTTGILDNFNRANEGPPPSANWTLGWFGGGGGAGLRVSSNQLGTASSGDEYWSAATFGPNSECYLTIATFVPCAVGIRLTTPGATTNGYWCVFGEEGATSLYRVDAGVDSVLGAAFTVSASSSGHRIGVEASGTTISVYEDTGGGWSLVAARTDGTHTGAGYIGVSIAEDPGLFDDFGGGTIVVPGSGSLPPMPRRSSLYLR